MINSFPDSIPLATEVEALPDTGLRSSSPFGVIVLSSTQLDQALELSDRVVDDNQRWQVYLNALALVGFEEWLQQRTTDVAVNRKHSTILQPQTMNGTAAVCNLEANGFRISLLGTESLLEGTLSIPRSVIDMPEFIAHFYVAAEIYEEQGQVILRGFLRYDQLINHQQTAPLPIGSNDTYQLPLEWFEPDLDRLLLHLSCLEPGAIVLPTPASASVPPSALASRPLHQVLVQSVVNAGLWLQQQWNEMTEELAWTLLPPFESANAMRSGASGMRSLQTPLEEFNQILTTLQRGGMSIPLDAQAAYRDFEMAGIPLRLYGVTAALVGENQAPEWSLLLVLKTQNETALPDGMGLRVRDLINLVDEQTQDQQSQADYLFTRVIGTLEEQFLVTIALNNQTLTLPPFAFR